MRVNKEHHKCNLFTIYKLLFTNFFKLSSDDTTRNILCKGSHVRNMCVPCGQAGDSVDNSVEINFFINFFSNNK